MPAYTLLKNLKGSVDNSGAQLILPLGTYRNWVTIENRDPTNGLVIGIANQLDPNSDFVIGPNQGLTFPFGIASDLYAMASAASVNWAALGH